MKKFILIAASALLFLAGCYQEIDGPSQKGNQTVTFTVSTEDVAATKAVADNDGQAANINHWVMEVRDSDGDVYRHQEDNENACATTHQFSVKLVNGQTYTVLFWADTQGTYNTADLTNVKLVDSDASGYAANKDSRDAFSAVKSNFTVNGASQNAITLKRPFAQLNVVFTDLNDLWNAMSQNSEEYLKFAPTTLKVTAKVPTTFNVQTQKAGDIASLNITADNGYLTNYANHGAEATIFMDYFFASSGSKDLVDVDFSFVSNGAALNHSFTSVPFQRNYRTNVKGGLMTADAGWEVSIDANWTDEPGIDVPYLLASTIQQVQNFIAPDAQSDQQAKLVVVKEEAVSTATATQYGQQKVIEFTLKANSPKEVSFQLPAISEENKTALGTDTWLVNYEDGYPTETVTVDAPAGTKVIINAPNSHVEVTGTQYANVVASTNSNSLVVPEGCVIDSLEIKQGGLEIYGTVNNVKVTGTADNVFVRECSSISEDVYNVLKNYIAEGYETLQLVGTGAATYDIIKIDEWQYYAAESFSNASGSTVTIMSAEELALFAKKVNAGVDYSGYKFILGADIDLSAHTWNPIMLSNNGSNIEIDGAEKTISGLQINQEQSYAGLFGKFFSASGVIKNFIIENPSVTQTVGTDYTAALCAWIGNGRVANCSVTGGTITGVEQVGGIVGHLNCGTVEGCTVDGVTISGVNRVGGISGKANVDSEYKITGNTVKNTTITSTERHDLSGAGAIVAQIITGATATWIIADNTVENVTTTTNGDATFVPVGEFRNGSFRADAVSGGHIVRNSWSVEGASDTYTMYNPADSSQSIVITNYQQQ